MRELPAFRRSRTGARRRPAPSASGTQYPGAMPCGKNMPTKRFLEGAAAVCASAVAAGTIASSSGSANVTPAPLRKVRRGKCFFETNMLSAPLLRVPGARGLDLVARNGGLLTLRIHLERLASDNAEHQRGETVLIARRVPGERADQRHVPILDAAAQRIRQQLFRDDLHELIGVAEKPRAEACRIVDLRAVEQLRRRVHGSALFVRAPQPDPVEVLEGETDRIHQAVALDAVGAHA